MEKQAQMIHGAGISIYKTGYVNKVNVDKYSIHGSSGKHNPILIYLMKYDEKWGLPEDCPIHQSNDPI